jgi:two-component system LytT family response regulator
MSFPVRLRALVVDDELPARLLLASLLQEDPEVELVGTCAGGEEALERIRKSAVDLLFLDIQMPGLDGFEVMRRLEGEKPPRVVFVTAHDDFAVNAFEVHALDYLLKPVPKQRLHETLERAKRQFRTEAWWEQTRRLESLLRENGPGQTGGYLECFQVRSGARLMIIPVERVSRLVSADHYTCIWSEGGSHLILRTMASLESDLDPARFVRIHRTTIVNVAHVAGVRTESGTYLVELDDGSRHAISRGRRDVLSRVLKATR